MKYKVLGYYEADAPNEQVAVDTQEIDFIVTEIKHIKMGGS